MSAMGQKRTSPTGETVSRRSLPKSDLIFGQAARLTTSPRNSRGIYTETTARCIDKRVERLADISCSLMSAFGGEADAGMATNRVYAVGVGTS